MKQINNPGYQSNDNDFQILLKILLKIDPCYFTMVFRNIDRHKLLPCLVLSAAHGIKLSVTASICNLFFPCSYIHLTSVCVTELRTSPISTPVVAICVTNMQWPALSDGSRRFVCVVGGNP